MGYFREVFDIDGGDHFGFGSSASEASQHTPESVQAMKWAIGSTAVIGAGMWLENIGRSAEQNARLSKTAAFGVRAIGTALKVAGGLGLAAAGVGAVNSLNVETSPEAGYGI